MNKPLEVHSFENRLDNLFGKIHLVADIELKAHWARYLCVMVSGYLETSMREILGTFAASNASPAIANYVQSQLEWFQNPNSKKILDLVRDFKADWADELEKQIVGPIKDAVDSVNNNRNSIAHGRPVGISFAIIQRYYADTKRFVERLLAIIP